MQIAYSIRSEVYQQLATTFRIFLVTGRKWILKTPTGKTSFLMLQSILLAQQLFDDFLCGFVD